MTIILMSRTANSEMVDHNHDHKWPLVVEVTTLLPFKSPFCIIKMMENHEKIMIMMMFFIHDQDHVQTLGDFSISPLITAVCDP